MTDLMSRPVLRVEPGQPAPRRPSALPPVLAAAAAAATGLIACLACAVAGWFSAGTGSFAGGVRAGAFAWLMSNGAGLHTPAAAITVVPLGASIVVAWLLYRAAYWAGSRSALVSLRDALRSTAVLAVAYCLMALTVAVAGREPGTHAGLGRTAIVTLVLAVVAGGPGLLRGSRLWSPLLSRTPVEARATLLGAAEGLAAMLLAGSLLFLAVFVAHLSGAVNVAAGMHAGVVGGVLIALTAVCLVPNAAVYAAAFAAGPGFALGTGTAVAPGGVRLGPLPAFPLLAAVPRDVTAGWVQLLVAVPVLAGVLAGLVVVRRSPTSGAGRAAGLGGLAGLLGAMAFTALCELASGAVGPGRMQDFGPEVTATLLVCGIAGVIGGCVAAAGGSWVGGTRSRRQARDRADDVATSAQSDASANGAATAAERSTSE